MSREPPPLGGLDLNLLVALRALLREASVTRAAASIGQTQPTVSRALAALRLALGDPLLVRSGRGMALTPRAQALRTPVERALSAIDRLRTVGERFVPSDVHRRFRVIVPDLVGMLLVPALTQAVAEQSEGITLQFSGSEREALRMMLSDEIDLVISAPPFDHPELYGRRVGAPMPLRVLCGRRHPCWGHDVDADSWLASTHVQVTPGDQPAAHSPIDERLALEGKHRHVGMYVSYVSALGPTLAQTPYMSTLPAPIAVHIAQMHDLQHSPHPFDFPPLGLRMSWHQLHHADPGHAWLRDLVATLSMRLFG